MDSKQCLLQTLRYSDIFDYPLTRSEICSYIVSSVIISNSIVEKSLSQMLGKEITAVGEYYCLAGREEIIKKRKQRKIISQQKLASIQRLSFFLRLVPTVRLLSISGSLARENAEEDADIDLFVIAAPGTVWITRLLLLGILQVAGRRRKHGQQQATDTMCLNMLMDESQLAFGPKRQDLYTASEIVQLHTLFDSGWTYAKLFSANLWLRAYLVNSDLPQYSGKLSAVRRIGTPFFRLFEGVSYILQRRIMQPRKTNEKVEKTLAAFHPTDYRTQVLNKLGKYQKATPRTLWDIDKKTQITYTRNDYILSPRYTIKGEILSSL